MTFYDNDTTSIASMSACQRLSASYDYVSVLVV